jgi:hypothetical protein
MDCFLQVRRDRCRATDHEFVNGGVYRSPVAFSNVLDEGARLHATEHEGYAMRWGRESFLE